MVAGRQDAVPATSRTAVTSLEPGTEWPSGVPETRGQTAITAEIPAVPVAPAYGVLLPDGSIWYPGSKRKLPAPAFLRVIVWTLAFLVALGGAGLIVEYYHPSWMDPIRHVVGPRESLPTAARHLLDDTADDGPSVEQDAGDRAWPQLGHLLGSRRSLRTDVENVPTVLYPGQVARDWRVLVNSTLGAGAETQVIVPNGSATRWKPSPGVLACR